MIPTAAQQIICSFIYPICWDKIFIESVGNIYTISSDFRYNNKVMNKFQVRYSLLHKMESDFHRTEA